MKILPPNSLLALSDQLHQEGAILVFTVGVFDLLHPGHIYLLREARKLGTHLIVGLYTDESTEGIQAVQRPVIDLEPRVEILAALEMVSYVTWLDRQDCNEMLEKIKPDVFVNGTEESIRLVHKAGGKTVQINRIGGESTTNIVERILQLPRS